MEDDWDVVLSGSELFKYLSKNTNETFELYDVSQNSRETSSFDNIKVSQSPNVSPMFIGLISEILHSSILLDEDAAYLFKISSELIPAKEKNKCRLATCSSLFVGSAICSCLFKRDKLIVFFPLVICSFSAAVYYIVNGMRNKIWMSRLKSLHSTLQTLYSKIKKCKNSVVEQEALILSRAEERLRNTCVGDQKLNENCDNYINFKLKECSTFKNFLINSLLELIGLWREATLEFKKTVPLLSHIDSTSHYLACSTHETTILNNESKRPSLDVLLNFYLLMQSESLRRLGLSFCPNVWSRTIKNSDLCTLFDVVNKFSRKCGSILRSIELQYNLHCVPTTIEKESKVVDSKLLDGYLLINRLKKSLTSLFFDLKILEDHWEKSCNAEFNLLVQEINCKLETLEQELENTQNIFHDTRKYFCKLHFGGIDDKESAGLTTLNELSEKQDKVNKTGIVVGLSDFAPSDVDRVYLGVTESSYSEPDIDVELHIEKPIVPRSLLTELKGALKNKKKEFEERELLASRANEDFDRYVNFCEVADTDENDPRFRAIKREQEIPNVQKNLMVKANFDSSGENFNEFSLQKSLAVKVANISNQWNKLQEETYYDSSDDNDDSN